MDKNVTVTRSLAMNREEFGTIIGVKGVLLGKYIRFKPDERVLLGRDSAQCDVVVPGIHISGVHMELRFDRKTGRYVVTDKSRNGVVLNEKFKLVKNTPTEVERGSHLLIGDTENEIVLG